MATLRQYILSQSTLLPGNTVRDHIKNPISGDTTRLILAEGLEVTVAVPGYTVEAVQEHTVEVAVPGYTVEINDKHSVGA